MFSSKRSRVIAAGVAAIAIAGGSYGIVTATSSSASATPAASSSPAGAFGSGGGSNARSGPAAGGAVGLAGAAARGPVSRGRRDVLAVGVKQLAGFTYCAR